MNIFILSENPTLCAQYHNDKHVIKMILESAQMLSTANRSTGLDEGYKATHLNHPCSIWARKSLTNWFWLRDLALELQNEWRYRYYHPENKMHKSIEVINNLTVPKLPNIGLTPFVQAMPDEFKNLDSVVAYRGYYIHNKAHIATWTRRDTPYWF